MKHVLMYTGIPHWVKGKLDCRLSIMEDDGSFTPKMVTNVIKNDPWSGTIETNDTIYVWKHTSDRRVHRDYASY